MIIVLKKSEKTLVAPGFDLGTSHTWGKHATTEPTLHHAAKSKYRRSTIRIWQDSFILSCTPGPRVVRVPLVRILLMRIIRLSAFI